MNWQEIVNWKQIKGFYEFLIDFNVKISLENIFLTILEEI